MVYVTILIALSCITAYHAAATDNGLNLPPPSILATMNVVNGTVSYFDTTLSDVPEGYDVSNGTYLGWCVDRTSGMSRETPIQVSLYSSLSPPGILENENWTLVNYVLNHKQGAAEDIQNATWYFINLVNYTYSPPLEETYAWAMINDALANGTGFIPTTGQTVAVICNPFVSLPQQAVQISIIEVTMPGTTPEFPAPAIPLFALAALSIVSAAYRKRHSLNFKQKNPP